MLYIVLRASQVPIQLSNSTLTNADEFNTEVKTCRRPRPEGNVLQLQQWLTLDKEGHSRSSVHPCPQGHSGDNSLSSFSCEEEEVIKNLFQFSHTVARFYTLKLVCWEVHFYTGHFYSWVSKLIVITPLIKFDSLLSLLNAEMRLVFYDVLLKVQSEVLEPFCFR